MITKKSHAAFFLISLFIAITSHASAGMDKKFCYPFYAGISGGYGSTTWEGLVPSEEKQNAAMSLSTPKLTREGGAVWGVFAGYELSPYFALEANYMRYPNAKVVFDSESAFSFDHDGSTSLNTHTETVGVLAKIMLIIPHTDIRAYSGAGAAGVHRADQLLDHWRLSPTFGVGFNYNVTAHIMGELGASYTSGYGEAELNPTEDYIPFLYSVFLRFAYRF